MKHRYDSTGTYYIFMCDRILKVAPIIGSFAAITFTIARLIGWFEFVDMTSLICFDIVCLSYFIVALLIWKLFVVKHKTTQPKTVRIVSFVIDGFVLLQWNLISYIFPTRSFWGFAPMFVLLTMFMFQTDAVLAEIIGISFSIAVSWMMVGDKLLPYDDGLFEENLILRIVALVISFGVIYLLTYFSNSFIVQAGKNMRMLESKNSELETIGKDIIDFTADIIEARDATSGSHVKRIKTYTKILAHNLAGKCPEYDLTENKIQQISLACVLHDVGKIAISDSILLKPGRLTAEEFEIIKTHTTIGAKIIDKLPDSIGNEYKRYCREICMYHHERWDGKGYPVGLKGDDIPISAQIVSVVDCFDALISERPYKKALPGDVAINMILSGECGAFSRRIRESIAASREQLLNCDVGMELEQNE